MTPAEKKEYMLRWRAANKERIEAYALNYRAVNKDRILKREQEYRDVNREWLKGSKLRYYYANREKETARSLAYYYTNVESYSLYRRHYRVVARAKFTALAANYRASKLLATPSWLTPADLTIIECFYTAARKLTSGEFYFLEAERDVYEVDHIVPLQSKRVCGLHIRSNLQILTRKENMSKGNRLLAQKHLIDYSASGYRGVRRKRLWK